MMESNILIKGNEFIKYRTYLLNIAPRVLYHKPMVVSLTDYGSSNQRLPLDRRRTYWIEGLNVSIH